MKIPLSWLSEFVELPDNLALLTNTLDDLGLVVEAVSRVGEGLDAVVVARVQEIHAIDGADRIRRVIADAGAGPVEIVCGATNFEIGSYVPFAPVGAVLPGEFVITQRKMRGVTSNGMLCSGRELGLGDDHLGLMILNDLPGVTAGQPLRELLGVVADVILEISPEGNRPDAWSVEGVARDLSARWASPLQFQAVATTNSPTSSSTVASGAIEATELCGALSVGVLRGVRVTESPRWLRDRLANAGMRAINNVVDASNYVMLETGQPTHPYDAALVVGRHLGVRQARPDEQLVTLDGASRPLGRPGRGLGDTGVDCVIVDGSDVVIGLAGIMGGATSEISEQTTEVLVEAAFFDPMTIARTSKRLGLRTEASSRFERGVDPTLAPRALARFVTLLQLSSPDLEWLADPVTAKGAVPVPPVIELEQHHIDDLIGTHIDLEVARPLLSAIGFSVESSEKGVAVTPPPGRLDVRAGAAGRADVIEEIARLYSYSRLARHTPTWVEPGALNRRQQFRRRIREVVIGLGFCEAWTPSLISDADYELADPSPLRVRITNPLASDESVLRSSLLVGLTRVWARNLERGLGDEAFFEIGTVVTHPGQVSTPRTSQGGEAGAEKVELPTEHERLLLLLGREGDDARSAVATWKVIAERLELSNIVIRSGAAPRGWHPTRHGELVVRATGEHVGRVGELDADFVRLLSGTVHDARRVGLVEIDLGLLGDEDRVPRRDSTVHVPSRFPIAAIDLAFVTPDAVNADDLRFELARADELVDEVVLFDVYRDPNLGVGVRSLAFAVRLGATDRTLSDAEIAASRERLIAAAATVHAQLR